MARRTGVLVALGALLFWGGAGVAGAADAVDAKAAFGKIKSLAGEWTAKAAEGGHAHEAGAGKVIYRVTAAGSAVVQTQFPGSDHEMVSVYHLDGDKLLLTHYCAAGNQPRLKFDPKASKADDLVFVFDGGTNLDPSSDMHIHGARIQPKGPKELEEVWEGWVGGKKAHAETFKLSKP